MNIDAQSERRDEGLISDNGPAASGTFTERRPFGESAATGAGRFGSGLSADFSADSGSGDSGAGGSEAIATGRKRGRPKGSKSGRGKLSAGELSLARRKLADTLSSVTGFSLSWYGTVRANKYKKVSLLLAQRVYGCYQIPREAAESVGEPLADSFMLWFPQYVDATTKSIDPAVAIGRLISILQQTSNNERLVVEQWRAMTTEAKVPTNGDSSPSPETEEFLKWMRSQSPQPTEIHPDS